MSYESYHLPPPQVDQSIYDGRYYRETCAGADTWQASGGREIDGLYEGMALKAGVQAGDVILDLGTGRGEFLVASVAGGAKRAIGIEYADAAVELARQTLAVHKITDRAEVLKADLRRVPLPNEFVDVVTMLDVIEHLATAELDAALAESFRVLKPGGRFFGHTFPTKTLYNVTYRVQRAAVPSRRKQWPANPRLDLEVAMHVNEQTLRGLRSTMKRAGFRKVNVVTGSMIYADFVPQETARGLYTRLARIPWLKRFGVADLWVHGTRPGN